MATSPLSSKDHLEEHDLGPEFKALINTFMQEVDAIGFQPDPDTSLFEICDDDRLNMAVTPLLEHLKFTEVMKILSYSSLLSTNVLQGSWGVRRVTQGGNSQPQNRTGALYIITLRTSGSPKISGKPLQVGHSIYLKQAFSVRPEVDCLLLAPKD